MRTHHLKPMTRELEQNLVAKWPSWFHVNGDLRHTLMPLGFVHGDGWFPLLLRLCEDLEPLVAETEKESGKPFEVLQVKEKFGTLRFYMSHHTDGIDERINSAQEQSSRTCEICGQRGKLANLQTRCDEHAQKK
jgi:hypothetical protein